MSVASLINILFFGGPFDDQLGQDFIYFREKPWKMMENGGQIIFLSYL